MSELGDTIIEVGPFAPGEEMGGLGMALHRSADLNELRDELIAGRKAVALLADLVDADPCCFDHNGGCQAHGYLSLEPGEKCPHERAKQLLVDLNQRADEHTEACR